MEFENLSEGEAAIWIAMFLCAGESCKQFDVQNLGKAKKNLEYSPSFLMAKSSRSPNIASRTAFLLQLLFLPKPIAVSNQVQSVFL